MSWESELGSFACTAGILPISHLPGPQVTFLDRHLHCTQERRGTEASCGPGDCRCGCLAMGTLHYLDDLKVREGKAGAEVHGTMVVQDTLRLEKAVTIAMGTVSPGEWSKCAWIEPLQQRGLICPLCNGSKKQPRCGEQVWRTRVCTSEHGRNFLNTLRPNLCCPALVGTSLLSTQF